MGDKEEVMKFTDEQIQELKQAFALFDMDGSGEVSTDELGTVLATLGQKVSDEELVEIIAEVDQDGGGLEFQLYQTNKQKSIVV